MATSKFERLGGPGKFGAWVRYGGKPITRQQLDFAIKNYSVAILQALGAGCGPLPQETCPADGGFGL